jgi:osmotically-inducible protein OsmY
MSKCKKRTLIMFVAAALTGATSASTYAQTDGTNTPPASKKEVRKQNHQLEQKVRHALTATRRLDSSSIVIIARGGAVTLDGDAPDDEQIQLAADTTSKVGGVTTVTNNLHVREAGH